MTEAELMELQECSEMFDFVGFTLESDKRLIAEVRRLREALRFYANEPHWHTTMVVPDGTYPGREVPAPGSREETLPGGAIQRVTAIDLDGGKKARTALEGRE